jgi:hypothetical protein
MWDFYQNNRADWCDGELLLSVRWESADLPNI